ncbi:hypothetical protein [Poseidonibacter lekithochrous]|uniref:hypothetical protein n=1 Tax=Poseidonibacter lekithochrous TaxID=1904463 RepID=UPI000D3909DB|nr:hypothetical protein [Poseidonibacter lekithochrous]
MSNTNENIHHLGKVCSEYCMSASEVYNMLLSKNDGDFPLSFDTVKYMVLKDVRADKLKMIFTQEELKSIFSNINLKKIKNTQTKNFINSL